MKAAIFVVMMACIAFVANAGVSEKMEKEFLWQNPGWDPWQGNLEEALKLAEVPDWAIMPILTVYPQGFQTSFVAKDSSKEDWMVFGKGKIRWNVRNPWNGQLKQSGTILGPVPKFGRVKEKTFVFTTDSTSDQKTLTKIRIRIWDWCGNISGTTWQETVVIPKKAVVAPKAQVQVAAKEPVKPEEKRVEKKKSPFGISFITELSHWSNNQPPLVTMRYEEAKVGTRFGWFLNGNARLETDVWLAARQHAVINGEHHSWQAPLFQIQPKLGLKPNWWSYLLVADAVTFSIRGFDSNTSLAMAQAHLAFLDRDWFEPMIQLGFSRTDSWPRYLSTQERYPESRARYKELKFRFQVARFGSVRLGYETTWFDFAKTRVDSNLALTNDLCYLAQGRPAYGGIFVQVKLPGEFYVDASLGREHIDAETYITDSIGSHWVPGNKDEWRINVVLSKGFRLDLFR